MEANALVAAGEGQSTYEGDEMVLPVMSETNAVLLLVGLFLAAMSKHVKLKHNARHHLCDSWVKLMSLVLFSVHSFVSSLIFRACWCST